MIDANIITNFEGKIEGVTINDKIIYRNLLYFLDVNIDKYYNEYPILRDNIKFRKDLTEAIHDYIFNELDQEIYIEYIIDHLVSCLGYTDTNNNEKVLNVFQNAIKSDNIYNYILDYIESYELM